MSKNYITRKDEKDTRELKLYQKKIINILVAMEEKYRNFSTIVELTTGGGKTITAVDYLLQQAIDREHKVLWLTHRDFLLKQALTAFEKRSNSSKDISYITISGSNNTISDLEEDTDIVFGSIFSMNMENDDNGNNNFKAWLKAIREKGKKLYVVIDEAHHVCSASYRSLLRELFVASQNEEAIVNNYALVGLTATPFREDYDEIYFFEWFKHGYEEKYVIPEPDNYLTVDTDKLKCIDSPMGELGDNKEESGKISKIKDKSNKIKIIDLDSLIKLGVVLEPEFIRVDDFNYTERLKHIESHKNSDSNNNVILDSFIENISKTKDLGKAVAFFSRTDEVAYVYKRLKNKYTNIFCLTSKEGDRQILDKFESMENALLLTVDIVSEGFDIKELNTIILVDATRSKTRLRQRVGRVVRGADSVKKCRVIWYYYEKNTDDEKADSYETKNKGYDLSNIQSEYSLNRDRTRKTYYLTAPKYKSEVTYQEKYDYTTSKEYRVLLDILELFRLNGDLNPKDYEGYYDFDGKIIFVDKVLNEGIIQLRHRVHTDFLIARHSKPTGQIDSKDIWGSNKGRYINDVMEVCFFLCKPSRKQIFYITSKDIEYIVEYLIKSNCNLPKLNKFHEVLIDIVVDLLADNPLASVDELMDMARNLEDYKKLINDSQYGTDLVDNLLNDFFKTKQEEIQEKAEESLNSIEEEVNKEIEEKKKIGEAPNQEEIEKLKISKVLKDCIEEKREKLYSKERKITPRKHDYTIRLEGGAFDKHLESLYDSIKSGANWSDKLVSCKCSKCGNKRPIVHMTFDAATKSVYCKDTCEKKSKKVIVLKGYINLQSIYTTQAFAQCQVKNIHHLIVTDDDITDFKDILCSSLKSYGVEIPASDMDALVKDFLCAMAHSNDFFKEVLSLCEKLPHILAYYLYDKVYEELAQEVNFMTETDGVRYKSFACQNEEELVQKANALLCNYSKFSLQDLEELDLYPIRDVIYDCKPYVKVLQGYQGIKPDLLCRMNNFIINQAVNFNSYLCGCGGSGADLINLHTNEQFDKQYFNEYGYAITTFYCVLQNDSGFSELQLRVSEFINYILDYTNGGAFENRIRDLWFRNLVAIDEKRFGNLCNKSSKELGEESRKLLRDNSSKKGKTKEDIEITKMLRYPTIKKIFTSSSGEFNATAYENMIVGRENILHGVFQRCQALYNWASEAGNEEIGNIGITDVDWAFITFIYLSFSDRQIHDNCFMSYFIQFASNYKSYLQLGHERMKEVEINIVYPRDIKKVIGVNTNESYKGVSLVDEVGCIAYCDIPYTETDSSMYVDDTFNDKEFIKSLNEFKGYYIVSSRYNICTSPNLKKVYYNEDKKEDENLVNSTEEKSKASKLKARTKSILEFYYSFLSEDEVFEIDDRDIKEFRGLMDDNRTPKYIIMPYTAAEEEREEKRVLSKFSNNYRISKEDACLDIERMLNRTLLSNIPVEVMITNIDMLGNEHSSENRLLKYYKLSDDVHIIPTFNSDSSSKNYLAEPVYVVMKYKWYIEKMTENICEKEMSTEDTKFIANLFANSISSLFNK